MKFLLAKRRAMGDTVLLSATVDSLQKAIPAAEISVLVPGAFRSLLEAHPSIRRIFSYEDGFWPLLQSIRAQHFDYFLQLHASPNTRWLGWLSGARQVRFHFQNKATEQAYGKHPNALEWDIFFLRSVLGREIPFSQAPKVYFRPEEQSEDLWAKRWKIPGQRVVFLGLGASRSTKRWPVAHFARLAELFRERLDLIPAFVTGPGEEEMLFSGEVLDQLRAKALRPIPEGGGKGDFIHVPSLGLRDLARALSLVRAYVGNDSGPKHLAAAVGVPTFTFFGPEDPVEWHPYDRAQHPVFFQEGLACRAEDNGRWCGIAECITEKHRCMQALDPLDAFLTIEKRIRHGGN